MTEIFSELNTLDLIRVVEQIKQPATFLVSTLFPNTEQLMSDILPVEYRKEHRKIAPYVIDGAKGINVKREKTSVKLYQAPLMGVRRVIGINDISRRGIGEMPIVSTKTPEDRARELAARDLVELQHMLTNSRTAQAAELLQTGKITVKAFADDGATPQEDVIEFNWTGKKNTDWTAANADILGDLREASYTIQEKAGIVPTLLICGKNVEKYMLDNKKMGEWLLSANSNATKFINYQPQFTSPQIRHLGFINALNLEMVSYAETYWDGNQAIPFLDPDSAILCCPGRGRQVYGSISLLENKQWVTYSAREVPYYSANDDAQTSSLALFSRFLLIPEDIDDFVCFKVKP